MDERVERRIITTPVDLRKVTEESTVPGLVGHAAVFNQRAVIAGLFVEIVEGKFFDPALREKHDVRMLYNHNPDLLLARTSSGTLRISKDEVGLLSDADLPPTTLGNDLQVLLGRRDVSQMSFAWTTAEDRWDTLPDDDPDLPGGDIRYLVKVKRLYDVSPVTYPAYEGTDVQLRSAAELYEQVHGGRKTRDTVEHMQRRARILAAGYQRRINQ